MIEKPKTKPSPKLNWSVPRWYTAHELRKLAPVVFGIRTIVRITVVSLLIGAGICVAAKLAFPQIQLAFVWKAVLAIPAMFAYVGSYFGVRLLIPAQVKITEEYIFYSTGDSGWRINLSEIESSKLIVYSAEHVQVVIRAKGSVRKLALSPTTALELLKLLLGSIAVVDKRAEFQTARRLVETMRSAKNAS